MLRTATLGAGLILLTLAACDHAPVAEPSPPTTTRNGLEPSFRVGTARVNHDPVDVTCVGGGASFCGRRVDPHVPGAIRDTLWARAAAFTGSNDQSFILITTTNIGYFLAYKEEEGAGAGIYHMRRRIAENTGVPEAHIVVVSDHSHNGPDTIGIWGGVTPAYKQLTADAVVAAATQAYAQRQPATLRIATINQNDHPVDGVPRLESSYNTAPGYQPEAGNPSNEFRMLVADQIQTGRRLLTLMNYAPHATVINGVAKDQLSGDWAAWAPEEAESLFGGFGLAAVGSVGATDWNKTGGDADAREGEARRRLRLLLSTAQDRLQPVQGTDILVQTTFIREPITQPVLLANYKPRSPADSEGNPGQHQDIRIDRSLEPPFLQGNLFGTVISAIRLGDLFFSTFPGEPFGELEAALRGPGGVAGPQAHFLLGAANDFFGYMTYRDETYQQTFATGATWIAGCPEQEYLYDPLGMEYDGACSDHWSLMVSATIGQHIICSLRDAADRIGFDGGARAGNCAALTALDDVAGPGFP